MNNSPANFEALDQPVKERSIVDLFDAGLLTVQARDTALQTAKRSRHWWRWADRSLLFVGSALLLAGVVFFFAYNWARMHAVAKLCSIEAGLWLCAIGALGRGLEKITGKVLLLSASILVGVLLAVYGQVYQTGADAYENYVLWALLIMLWAIVGRFNALWVLWLVITNVAMLLFWFQVAAPERFEFVFGIFLLLGIWNSIALAAREYGLRRGLDWLSGRWSLQLIWFAVLVYLTIPALVLIVNPEFGNGSLAGAIGLAVALVAGHLYFRTEKPDLLCLGFNVLSFCLILLTFVGKALFEAAFDPAVFLIFGLIVLGTSSAAAFYLRNLARSIGDAGS